MSPPEVVFELLLQTLQLSEFELGDLQSVPAIGGSDDSGVHQLQDRALAEEVARGASPSTLLSEEALQEVGGANHPAVAGWALQLGNARSRPLGDEKKLLTQLP